MYLLSKWRALCRAFRKDFMMLIPIYSRPKKPMIAPSRMIIVDCPAIDIRRLPTKPDEEQRRVVIAAKYVRQK